MTRDFAYEVRDEQIKVLFRQARVVFLPNLVAAPAVVYVLWPEIAHAQDDVVDAPRTQRRVDVRLRHDHAPAGSTRLPGGAPAGQRWDSTLPRG